MHTREHCLEQAEICEEYAALAIEPRVREEWIETALAWLQAADCEPLGPGGDVRVSFCLTQLTSSVRL